jgi:hypothetical protein
MGIWDGKNIGDRDISEGDTNEVNLYRNTIEEIRPASQVGYIRGWDIKGWGFKRGMTVISEITYLRDKYFWRFIKILKPF